MVVRVEYDRSNRICIRRTSGNRELTGLHVQSPRGAIFLQGQTLLPPPAGAGAGNTIRVLLSQLILHKNVAVSVSRLTSRGRGERNVRILLQRSSLEVFFLFLAAVARCSRRLCGFVLSCRQLCVAWWVVSSCRAAAAFIMRRLRRLPTTHAAAGAMHAAA